MYVISLTDIIQHHVYCYSKVFIFIFIIRHWTWTNREGTFYCYNYKITKINEVFVIISYISIIGTIVITNSEALFGGV